MTDAIPKAKYIGKLNLGGYEISCAVLDNGKRVLVERTMANALGKKGSGAYWQRKKGDKKGAFLPEYVSARYLENFVNTDLKKKLEKPVQYINKNRRLTTGVDATVLPDICDVWITAKEKGALDEKQSKTAARAYILMKAFATVGIIALVDEVTGYQEVRDRDELNRILEAYIAKELLPWTKRFPDEFYQQMFRLRGWIYSPLSIKRPQYVGKLTNEIIYEKLPPGILNELRRKNPRTPKGHRKHRHHQFLTLDIGDPHLEKHLASVTTLMRASPNWATFNRLFQRAFPPAVQQGEFPFDELEE